MPGGFLKKLGTASCGITGMLVAVALLCADTGRESGANISDSAPTIATRVSENVRHRFIAATSRTRPGPAPNERPIIAPDHGATEAQSTRLPCQTPPLDGGPVMIGESRGTQVRQPGD